MKKTGTGISIFDFDRKNTVIPTGQHSFMETSRDVTTSFGDYVVTVCLDENDKFLGIKEIKLSKDFLSIQQKVNSSYVIDVEEFYDD